MNYQDKLREARVLKFEVVQDAFHALVDADRKSDGAIKEAIEAGVIKPAFPISELGYRYFDWLRAER